MSCTTLYRFVAKGNYESDEYQPFGGKFILMGGDFRQTLPVVPRRSRTDIIAVCIKNSPLWHHFKVFHLTTNMRSDGHHDFNEWLLSIGDGILTSGDNNLEVDNVEIPPNY